MIVTRVQDPNGSHIEPPLNEEWDDATKLRWHAAVVTHETGLAIEVHEHGSNGYSLTIGRTSISSSSYHSTWNYLNGVHTGAEEVQRAGSDQPKGHQ